MTTPRTARFGAVLAYFLATLLAQAGDLHGHDAPSETHCQSTCGDSRPHLSGHASVDLGRLAPECPACQFRSMPLVPTADARSPTEPRPVAPAEVEPPARGGRSEYRASSRGPPRP